MCFRKHFQSGRWEVRGLWLLSAVSCDVDLSEILVTACEYLWKLERELLLFGLTNVCHWLMYLIFVFSFIGNTLFCNTVSLKLKKKKRRNSSYIPGCVWIVNRCAFLTNWETNTCVLVVMLFVNWPKCLTLWDRRSQFSNLIGISFILYLISSFHVLWIRSVTLLKTEISCSY